MKATNFISNNGNAVKNQFILTDGNKRIFQSYNSIIVVVENGVVTLDRKYWDYSKTTGKYRNMFLGESKAETLAKINSGVYKLANLNF